VPGCLPCRRRAPASTFTEARLDAGIAGSIGSVGDVLDNALMESTIDLYKTELVDRQRSWNGRNEVERGTAAWVHWFNTERLHSAIDYRPPAEFENTAALAVAGTERPSDPGRFTAME
jgi:transposase InsO family protein